MPGPPKKPTALKLVAGNPGKRALNKLEPKPRGNLYDAPDWLTDTQRVGWAYAIELSPAYVDVAVIRWQDFTGEKAVHEDGRLFDDMRAAASAKAAA